MFHGDAGEDGQVRDQFEGLKDQKTQRNTVEHMLALTKSEQMFCSRTLRSYSS